MAPKATKPPTDTHWTTAFDTARWQKLFRDPPTDRSPWPVLHAVVQPHIDSFNAIFEDGGLLQLGLDDIGVKTFVDGRRETPAEKHQRLIEGRPAPRRNRLSLRVREVFLDKSVLPPSNKYSTTNREVLPAECRERHCSYRGRLRARLEMKVNNDDWKESVRELGPLPIMVKSNRCHLQGLSPAALIEKKEEAEELGGYYIVNGIEKIIRLLIVPKRNFPMAIVRQSFQNRGPSYTKFGIQIRSVRQDQTSQTNVLHYLNDGNVTFRFSWRKNEYLVPVMMILNALVETNDREIFEGLVGTAGSQMDDDYTFLSDRVELLLRTYKSYKLHGQYNTRSYLGNKFRPVIGVAEDMTDDDCGAEFLRRVVLPHLGGSRTARESQDKEKFKMLLFMIRKLYALVRGDCSVDNPDAVSNQEILLGGFLYGMILKEKINDWMDSIAAASREWSFRHSDLPYTSQEFQKDFFVKIVKRTNENIGGALEYFLSTGNLSSSTGLDLQQTSGYTVVAEKINFHRFLAHFRMVHRGSFFAQLKTTTVRKLLPESWGFLCPVHTPDGAPCGLLNHLAHKCIIATHGANVSALPRILADLGVSSFKSSAVSENVVVQLDGRILGFCSPKEARIIADTLRYWKVEGGHKIPVELEIGYIPNSNGGQYPGIYMFSQSARMYRPVKYLPLGKLDYVGPFEQPYMEIACTTEDIISGVSTHVESDPTNILSILANLTPFSDFNQSPRNLYQCQMGKQAMGTPATSLRYRTDNKLYRLQTGQTPIVRPPLYSEYGLDNYPNGMNAVVAVIAYTGYDMDDAMIINKSAHERGFGHGTIYKTKFISLDEAGRNARVGKAGVTHLFGFAPSGEIRAEWKAQLDSDGLPYVGQKVSQGDYICAYYSVIYDSATDTFINQDGRTLFHKYKDAEEGYIDEVRVLGTETGNDPCQVLSLKIRIPRSPVIGDKFSSRHGQKGVCSQKFPAVDMPFSESGIIPDVIINPHAFPSRMTIGMFIESLAGKAGALHGIPQDCTPWRFDEEHTAADYFGHQLMKAGYNYHGNEPMYSGITGREFAADIYLGVVYYQRLRHMVNDKFQVRTTGPLDQLTGQPIKGRARGGGIRVGEMERDSLLAHGTAFLLQDRLLNCSDYTKAWLCRDCGCFLGVQNAITDYSTKRRGGDGIVRCRLCAQKVEFDSAELKMETWADGSGARWKGGENVRRVAIPGVLRYLDAELAAMGIKMRFRVEP